MGQENHCGTVHWLECPSSSVTKLPASMWDHMELHTFYTWSGHNRWVHEHTTRTSLRYMTLCHIRTESSTTPLSEAQTCTQVWVVSWVQAPTITVYGDTREKESTSCAMTWDKQLATGFVHEEGAHTCMSRHTWKWLISKPFDINARIVNQWVE